MVYVLLGMTQVSDTRWMTLTDHPGAARLCTRDHIGRELARPVQGQSADLASTTTRTPATIQVRKLVGLRNFALVRVVAWCLAKCADLWEGILMSTGRMRLEGAADKRADRWQILTARPGRPSLGRGLVRGR
jgi:hypothetical protein